MICKLIPIDKKENLQIFYGHGDSVFGGCFIAWTDNKICFLGFGKQLIENKIISDIKTHWPNSQLTKNNQYAFSLIKDVFEGKIIDLIVSGTDFQIKVWNELLKVHSGKTISYEELAERVERKSYTRPCASAVARNNISYLIPCHRIIRKSGDINKYRWGAKYKQKILEYEKRN